MSLDLIVLLPLALGHLSLFVLIVNIVHALGHRGPTADGLKIALLSGFTLGSGILAWEAWQGGFTVWSWPSLLYGFACLSTGLFFLPLSTVLLQFRDHPQGIAGKETRLDLAASRGKESLVGSGSHGWMLRLPGNHSFLLSKVECRLNLPDLPPALDGLSLLHISDVHFSPAYSRTFFEAVFEEASESPADLVVFTGDLVDSDDAIDWIVPLFSKLRGRLGSYSILGNHDLEHSPALLCRRLEEAGFTDLEGRWATLESGGSTLALGGTSFPWGPPLPLADRPRADYKILLSHTPDRFFWAEKHGFDLMLSGHNHGGQIRFPIVGAVFMPSLYSRRFDRGFFRKRKLTLHVSQGIGGKHPIRYGCPPEITRLILRASSSGSSRTSTTSSTNRLQSSI